MTAAETPAGITEAMSNEQPAHSRADNEPVGDHRSGLTADEEVRITDVREACEILAAARKDQALTHLDVVTAMGCSSAPTMSQLESGHHNPTLRIFLAWSEALGFEVRLVPNPGNPSHAAVTERTLQRLSSGEARLLREKHRLSRHALAETLGVRAMTIARWELGKGIPRTRVLIAYGEILDRLAADGPAVPTVTRCVYGEDGLGTRTQNTLRRAGIDLETATAMSDDELLSLDGIGHAGLARIRKAAR